MLKNERLRCIDHTGAAIGPTMYLDRATRTITFQCPEGWPQSGPTLTDGRTWQERSMDDMTEFFARLQACLVNDCPLPDTNALRNKVIVQRAKG